MPASIVSPGSNSTGKLSRAFDRLSGKGRQQLLQLDEETFQQPTHPESHSTITSTSSGSPGSSGTGKLARAFDRLNGRGRRQQLLHLDEATLQQPPQSECYFTNTPGGGSCRSPADVIAASRNYEKQSQCIAAAESSPGCGSAPPTPSFLSKPPTPSRLSPGAAMAGKMSRALDRVRGRGHARLSEEFEEEPPQWDVEKAPAQFESFPRSAEVVSVGSCQPDSLQGTGTVATDPSVPQPWLLGAQRRSPRFANPFKRSDERQKML